MACLAASDTLDMSCSDGWLNPRPVPCPRSRQTSSSEAEHFKQRILDEIQLRRLYKEVQLRALFKAYLANNAQHRAVLREVITDLKAALNIM